MVGLISLTLSSPLKSAPPTSIAQDLPAMARINDATFKRILTQWEKKMVHTVKVANEGGG